MGGRHLSKLSPLRVPSAGTPAGTCSVGYTATSSCPRLKTLLSKSLTRSSTSATALTPATMRRNCRGLQQAHLASRRRTGAASVQLGRPREADQVYKRNRGHGDETGRRNGQGRNLGTWRYGYGTRGVECSTTKDAYFMLVLGCVGALAGPGNPWSRTTIFAYVRSSL